MDSEMKYKMRRKVQKYKSILFNDYGIIPVTGGTKSLMVCNAGLVNGFDREEMLQFFGQFGDVEKILTYSKKSYSFITYKSVRHAEQCYSSVNGRLKLSKMNGPLYLLFIQQVPEADDTYNFISDPPPGLVLIEDFVNEEEEDMLLNCVNAEDFAGQPIKHRQVKHFGFEFLYTTNTVDKNKPLLEEIPPECDFMWERLQNTGHEVIRNWKPNQLTINYYFPGQGIPPHIDTHSSFGDPILSLSLGSDVVMDFKRSERQWHSVLLPRRSLLIMSGESRYAWTHGITPRKYDVVMTKDMGLTTKERGIRISFTFRYVQQGDCKCSYPEFCDSVNDVDQTIPEKDAVNIETEFVQKVYDNISEHFSHTRHSPWPNVLKFVKAFPIGSVLIDLGCGNGKYFGLNKGLFEVGCDISSKLAYTCRSRGFETAVSNCLNPPFRPGIADCVISIAVIHHLATRNRRIEAIRAIARLLTRWGRALIYVWAKEQVNDNKKSNYLKRGNHNPSVDKRVGVSVSEVEVGGPEKLKLPIHTNRTPFKYQDMLVPWKLNNTKNEESASTFLRYYHVFEENELEELCKEVRGIQVESSYYDEGNWCVVIMKL